MLPNELVLNVDVVLKAAVPLWLEFTTKESSTERLPAESEVIAEEEFEKSMFTKLAPFVQLPAPVSNVMHSVTPAVALTVTLPAVALEAKPHRPYHTDCEGMETSMRLMLPPCVWKESAARSADAANRKKANAMLEGRRVSPNWLFSWTGICRRDTAQRV